jgi:abhydrolase domain-containing protein 14
MQNIHEKYVRTGASEIHILAAGAPGGRDIILLHGMKFQAETWRKLNTLEQLAAAGHRVLAVDMPGFGRSKAGSEPPDSVLRAIIGQEKLTRPVLLGPSMGGRLCLEFAIGNPALVGGLVLVGAVGVQENKEKLAAINIPCLIIWGGNDQISPLTNGQLLAREIKDARLVVIDQAPHPCYLEQPEIFHRELLAYLSEGFSG